MITSFFFGNLLLLFLIVIFFLFPFNFLSSLQLQTCPFYFLQYFLIYNSNKHSSIIYTYLHVPNHYYLFPPLPPILYFLIQHSQYYFFIVLLRILIFFYLSSLQLQTYNPPIQYKSFPHVYYNFIYLNIERLYFSINPGLSVLFSCYVASYFHKLHCTIHTYSCTFSL